MLDVYRLRQRKTQLSLIEFGFVVWQIESFKVNLLYYLCLACCVLYFFSPSCSSVVIVIVVVGFYCCGITEKLWQTSELLAALQCGVKCKSWLSKTLSWLQQIIKMSSSRIKCSKCKNFHRCWTVPATTKRALSTKQCHWCLSYSFSSSSSSSTISPYPTEYSWGLPAVTKLEAINNKTLNQANVSVSVCLDASLSVCLSAPSLSVFVCQ